MKTFSIRHSLSPRSILYNIIILNLKGFPQMEAFGWFTRENPIKMDDLGVPGFMEPPLYTLYPCP